MNLTERQETEFFKRVEKTDTCWLWIGNIDANGYGRFYMNPKTTRAHRVSFFIHKGEVPTGLVLDHLCRIKHCVNPEHLEAVSNWENVARGIGITARNAQKTHCKRGHEMNEENTRRPPSNPRARRCKKCEPLFWRPRKKPLKVKEQNHG